MKAGAIFGIIFNIVLSIIYFFITLDWTDNDHGKAMVVVLLISYIIHVSFPGILRIKLRSTPLRSHPTEFKGRYHRVLTIKRFIFSSGGIFPAKHNIFFNELLMKDIPRGSAAFLIAHEYAHYIKWHLVIIMFWRWMSFFACVAAPAIIAQIGYTSSLESGVFHLYLLIAVSLFVSVCIEILYSWMRREMEYAADKYAKAVINPSRHEVARAFVYLRSNRKISSFSYYPSPASRLMHIFNMDRENADSILDGAEGAKGRY